jgi:endo-1,4-beta-xylanase
VAANIKRLGALGLEVHVTEMDVRCDKCNQQRLEIQASIYGMMMEACLNNSGVCKSFETWGFTDAHTWLSSFNNPDHLDVAPLPFDLAYGKKPAYEELLAVLTA